MIRDAPWYRASAFARGLKAAGYEKVFHGAPVNAQSGEVLVIWNRYGHTHEVASAFERDGGTVIVAENGYLGAGGTSPKFDVHPGGPQPHHYYSLSLGWHNGRGKWKVGGSERFAALGVELTPMRKSGKHVLVCPNRSFGVGEQVMRPDWADRCAERLRKETSREVRIRRHPGNNSPARPLAEDLKDAWAVYIWSSGAGIHSLLAGIPTFVEAPYWIMKGASASGSVEDPKMPVRDEHFQAMAWAQWTCAEIETGEPFRHLLQ